jgi:hypothetical protein
MQDTAKYLIHANIAADGVVERSDVVGAIFGQTEGLLGDELDLRDLQDASKVGRIDVDITSQHGQSFGDVTIATSLDKVETAILGAALETIDRVGPCKSTIEVDRIEDVRAAKRREVVERAQQLLQESFEGSVFTSEELVEEVRAAIRVEDATEYEGLPAGPRVADSDAVVVVEGRADVLQLLQYGIKNAIAVEGTDVPDVVADLSRDRTVTAFLDGDRGGDLILEELVQVGDVDYVAFAPPDRAVEDLDRHEVMAALRDKVPYGVVAEADDPRSVAATDGSASPAPDADAEADQGAGPDAGADPAAGPTADANDGTDPGPVTPDEPSVGEPRSEGDAADGATAAEAGADAATSATDADGAPAGLPDDSEATDAADATPGGATEPHDASATPGDEPDESDGAEADADPSDDAGEGAVPDDPETLRGHVRQVVGESSGRVRLVGPDFRTLGEDDAGAAFEAIRDAEPVPSLVVLDGTVSQRVLDVAAQRGVDQIVAASEGAVVKRPTGVRVRTADELQVAEE